MLYAVCQPNSHRLIYYGLPVENLLLLAAVVAFTILLAWEKVLAAIYCRVGSTFATKVKGLKKHVFHYITVAANTLVVARCQTFFAEVTRQNYRWVVVCLSGRIAPPRSL